jgi:hypothetical protein
MNGKSSKECALLVFNAKFASPTSENRENLGAKRLRRFYLQAVAREIMPGNRVADCLRSVVPGKRCVNIKRSPKFERSWYGNLVQCANVWIDPVCSSKITERRRVELEGALERSPWPGVMVTYTEQHGRTDKLVGLRGDLGKGLRRLKSGKWWQGFAERWGIAGSISANEVTYGLESGWHPHVHALYLVEVLPDTEAMRSELSAHFEAIMAKSGRYVSPEIGVHVRATTNTAADYISKWSAAYEITKAPSKRGRGERYNAFELLQVYAEGHAWGGEAFREYAAAMKGVNQIRWSRGLRKLLGMGEEVTDQELVEAPMESEVVLASLTLAQWGIILKRGKRGELMEVASLGDRHELRVYLKAIGVNLVDD